MIIDDHIARVPLRILCKMITQYNNVPSIPRLLTNLKDLRFGILVWRIAMRTLFEELHEDLRIWNLNEHNISKKTPVFTYIYFFNALK